MLSANIMCMSERSPVVLIVDDESDVADAYAELLSETYETRVAYGGKQAIEKYDPSVDVVLLDRRMPDMSGDEVLERIREMGGDSRVAMVTAVDPSFDVIEMGFDEYLVKPVSTEELDEAIQTLMKRSAYEAEVQLYFSLVTKKARLEAEKSAGELAANDDYQAMLDEISEIQAELDEAVGELTMEDYAVAFRDLNPDHST